MNKRKKHYYTLMGNFGDGFDEIHKNWFWCFSYILKSFNAGFNKKSIKSLFYDFDMSNWTAMHKENSEYADYDKDALLDTFFSESSYICDRTSYDRLFRTHWLFRKAFEYELNVFRFASIYEPSAKNEKGK